MAQNKIQIKRSTANAVVTGLANGELAFTQAGNVLYVGAPDGTSPIRIGGQQVPGTLTANQALVANATSGIDKVIVANLAANSIWANGSSGTAGDVLYSNGTATYWKAPSAGVAGSDTQIQFNDGGALAGDPGLTFVKATDTLTVNGVMTTGGTGTGTGGTIQNNTVYFIGNNTINTVVTSAGLNVNGSATIANSTGVYTGVVNATSHTSGATGTGTGGTIQNTTVMFVGNNTINSLMTSAGLAVNGTATVANSTGVYTGTVNAASHTVGTAFTANSTVVNAVSYYAGTLLVANTTVINATHLAGKTEGNLNVNSALTANNASNLGGQLPAYYTNASNITTGTLPYAQIPANIVNTTGSFTLSGNTTLAGTNTTISSNVNVTGSFLNVASAFLANSTGAYHTGLMNAASFRVGSNFIANTTQVTLSGTTLSANGGVGSQGQVLASNGATGSPYWTSVGTITGVTAGAGLTGGGSSGSVTVDVGAGNGISVAADAVAVLANGSSAVVSNTTGVHIKIGAGLVFDGSGNVAVNSNALTNFQDLTVSGNLTVLGDLVSLNVATLTVEDSMITLAKDQSATASFTDAVDIGFFGTYGSTANAFISGLFRDQSDSGVWKLFASNGTYTNAIINTTNTAAFSLSTLQAYLTSSGLTTNAGSVYVTANSTVNVNISANIISLSGRANNDLIFSNGTGGLTGLALGTTGYVLQSNGTAIVYDTLDGGTF